MNEQKNNPLLPRAAVIREKLQETADTFSLRLSAIAQDVPLNFQPGQFNMLSLPGIGEAPFSFSMIDEKNKIFVQTIRMAGNVVGAIGKLQKGQTLWFRGPYGTGWPLDKLQGKNVIIVAGGIGMAPLRPVIHYLMKNLKNYGKIYLLYGAKTTADILFKDELAMWSQKIHVLLSADKITDRSIKLPVHEGLVTYLFEKIDVDMENTVTLTCGPQIMMKFAAAGLIMEGHSHDDIYLSMERRMKCGIAHCGHCQIGTKFVCKDGPVFSLPDIQKNPDTLL
jgi:sulfhydrogenase subunit gamma (sulfur reductase)